MIRIIIRKDAAGDPTGIIDRLHVYYFGPYVAKLMNMLPDAPLDVQERGVIEEIGKANAAGITAIDETHFITPDNIKVLAALREARRLNLRVNLAYEIPGAKFQLLPKIESWLQQVAARMALRVTGASEQFLSARLG